MSLCFAHVGGGRWSGFVILWVRKRSAFARGVEQGEVAACLPMIVPPEVDA